MSIIHNYQIQIIFMCLLTLLFRPHLLFSFSLCVQITANNYNDINQIKQSCQFIINNIFYNATHSTERYK